MTGQPCSSWPTTVRACRPRTGRASSNGSPGSTMPAPGRRVARAWGWRSSGRLLSRTAARLWWRTHGPAHVSSYGCRVRRARSAAGVLRAQLLSRMLDQRDDPSGHEIAGADSGAAPGDLGDLDLSARG